MACEIVDRHLENIDNVFLYLDEIFFYTSQTTTKNFKA
jgi:hypothetical protein